MAYGSNQVVNGDGTSLTGWTSSGVTVKTGGPFGSYFELASTASMTQAISDVQFILSPQHYLVKASFALDQSISPLDNTASLHLYVTVKYFNGEVDKYNFPMEEYGSDVIATDSTGKNWFSIEGKCPLREDDTLTGLDITVKSADLPSVAKLDDLSLQRFMTDLEAHENDENPHNLPLAITVNQQGIKATKGSAVQFWLKDTGDAVFAGQLDAASGTFKGRVEAGSFIGGNIDIGTGTFTVDSTGAMTATSANITGAISGSTFTGGSIDIGTGAFKVDSTGAVSASNITLSGGSITWGGTAMNVPAKSDMGNWTTKIDANGIYTGSLTAGQIKIDGTSTFAAGYDPTTKETPTGAQTKANNAADGVRTDLRMTAPLPTDITMDGYGITAHNSTTTGYARMDYRGLYIYGGAIQISGGLAKSQINSDTVNGADRGFTYIDSTGVYAGTISADNITAGTITGDYISGGVITGSTLKLNSGAKISPTGTAGAYVSASDIYLADGYVYIGESTLTTNIYGSPVKINGSRAVTVSDTDFIQNKYPSANIEMYVNSANELVVYKSGSYAGKVALV